MGRVTDKMIGWYHILLRWKIIRFRWMWSKLERRIQNECNARICRWCSISLIILEWERTVWTLYHWRNTKITKGGLDKNKEKKEEFKNQFHDKIISNYDLKSYQNLRADWSAAERSIRDLQLYLSTGRHLQGEFQLEILSRNSLWQNKPQQ